MTGPHVDVDPAQPNALVVDSHMASRPSLRRRTAVINTLTVSGDRVRLPSHSHRDLIMMANVPESQKYFIYNAPVAWQVAENMYMARESARS